MSNPSAIPAGLPIPGSGSPNAPSRSNAPAQAPAAAAAKPVQLFVNPSFRFDPSVGMVVIEFHNDTGKLSNSIPSQRQLAAYRNHQETPSGQSVPEIPKATQTVTVQAGDVPTGSVQASNTKAGDALAGVAQSFDNKSGDAKTTAG